MFPVCYWPGVIRVAEHLVMQLGRWQKLREVDLWRWQQAQNGALANAPPRHFAYNWSRRVGVKPPGSVPVGVGFGEIGVELARRLKGWGCTLLYNKRRRLPQINLKPNCH